MAVQLDDVMARVDKAVGALEPRATVAAAFLFGSQAEGTADADSDIDLAVFVRGEERWNINDEIRLCTQVRRAAGSQIELHFFPETALDHPEPASFAAYVQKHGVRIKLDKPH